LLGFGVFEKRFKRLRLGYFAIAEGLYDLEDLRPGRESFGIFLFVFFDGQKKFKLLRPFGRLLE
jgi:hypothetical protein